MNDNILVADIEGYAAIFGERDLNGDIIAPGAFARSLDAAAPVRMLYQHAAETPIGRWTSFTEDAYGLFVAGEVLLSSAKAREVHALLTGGALDGLSIGYQTVKARKEKSGARRIIEASLWEVSIVTFPMAPRARVSFIGSPRPQHQTPEPHCAPGAMPSPPAREAARRSGRASASSPRGSCEVRCFADALRSAANIVSV